jgi:hypothetical protein
MNPYSHLVIASKLEAQVRPENAAEYYWGAVAPDVRYPARMQRDRTHHHRQKSWTDARQPAWSFLLGYTVHCLADEIDLGIFQHLPFSLFKPDDPPANGSQFGIVLFREREFSANISTAYNAVLQAGVGAERLRKFCAGCPALRHRLDTANPFLDFPDAGVGNDTRLKILGGGAQHNPADQCGVLGCAARRSANRS